MSDAPVSTATGSSGRLGGLPARLGRGGERRRGVSRRVVNGLHDRLRRSAGRLGHLRLLGVGVAPPPGARLHPGLQPVEPGRQGGGVGGGLRPGDAEECQLDDQALLPSLTELQQCLPQGVDGAEHVGTRDGLGQPGPLGQRVGGLVDDLFEVRGVLSQEDAAEVLDRLGDEPPQVGSPGGELGHQPQRTGGVALGDGGHQGGEGLPIGQPQGPPHRVEGDRRVGVGRHLLQHRHTVPHGAAGVDGDRRQGVRLGIDALDGGDGGEVFDQVAVGHRAEVEPLAPAPDGVEQLVRLGGGQHEDDVVGRFLERLEQGVTGGARQHVGLVEDVDALGPAGRRHRARVDPDLPHVLDLVVRGGVQLDDVEGGAFGDGDARHAGVARLGLAGVPLRAVEGLGEQPRRARLAGPAGAGEQVRVGDPSLHDLARQGLGDVFLADDLVEALGAVLAVERLVVHWQPMVAPGSDTPSGRDLWHHRPWRGMMGRVEVAPR